MPLWDIFGIVLTITLFENLLLIYLNLVKVNKKSKFGYRLHIFCYIFLVFIILGMWGMMQGNLLSSTTISNSFMGGYALNHISYFGILTFGTTLVMIDFLTRKNPKFWGRETRRDGSKYIKILRFKEIVKKIIIITSWIGLCIGAFCAFITLFGVFEFVTTQIACFSSQYGVFLSFIFLANTIILLKIKK